MPCIQVDKNTIICMGDTSHKVRVKDKWISFEITYFGPWPLKKNGDPRINISKGFWDAVTKWWRRSENKKYHR